MHPDEQAHIEAMVRANFFPGDPAVQGMFDALLKMSRIGAGVSYMLEQQAEDSHGGCVVRLTHYQDGVRILSNDIVCSLPMPTIIEAIDRAVSATREIHDKGGL